MKTLFFLSIFFSPIFLFGQTRYDRKQDKTTRRIVLTNSRQELSLRDILARFGTGNGIVIHAADGVDSITWNPPYLCSWTENFPTCYNLAYKDTVIFAAPLKVVPKEESGAAHDTVKIEGGNVGVEIGNTFRVVGTAQFDIPGKGAGKVLTSDSNGVATWQVPPATTGGGTGTVTSVAALTLGTSGTNLSSTVTNPTTKPVITLNVPTASATNRGVLSPADWSNFNNKQPAINGTGFVKATGTTISYDNSTYLTTSAASSTYLTTSAASTNYARKNAANTFTGVQTFSSVPAGTMFTIVSDPIRLAAPADAATYYYGTMNATMSSVVNNQRFPIGINCTLIGVTFATRSSLASSAENSSVILRKNNQYDLTLSNAIKFTGGQAGNMYTVSGAGITENYNAGDYVELKWKCPTWATNPTNIGLHTILYFKTR